MRRTSWIGAGLVALAVLAGCGGDDGDAAGTSPTGPADAPAETATDGPCALVTAEDVAAAGFTMPLVGSELQPESLDYHGFTVPGCELEFQEGTSTVVVTLQLIPAEAEPSVDAPIAASGGRALEGVGDDAFLSREEDSFEPGEHTVQIQVLVDGAMFQMSVPEELADEEAVVTLARRMVERLG